MSEERKKSQEDYDWDHRILCSDGNCIGVIGRDGRCKECGLEYDGELPWEKSDKTDGEEDGRENGEEESAAADDHAEESGTASSSDENWNDESIVEHWNHRVLCVDGNCIGVIGTNGRCKECGKPGPKKK